MDPVTIILVIAIVIIVALIVYHCYVKISVKLGISK